MSTYLAPESSATASGIVGTSDCARELRRLCELMVRANLPILLAGPPGTEFERIAAHIHALRGAESLPLVRQRGLNWQDFADPLRIVGSGTLLVEGIEHASLPVQLRLLAEIDEAKYLRQQSDAPPAQLPQIVASTTTNLADLVTSGLFLDDLYWQLCALTITVAPLAQRIEDLPPLVDELLLQIARDLQLNHSLAISDAALAQLQSYQWPGNYRELASVLLRSATLCDGEVIECVELPCRPAATDNSDATISRTETELPTQRSTGQLSFKQLVELVVTQGIVEADRALREPHGFIVNRVEQAVITAILAECDNVQTKAAIRLGINRNTLHKKIKEYGLE